MFKFIYLLFTTGDSSPTCLRARSESSRHEDKYMTKEELNHDPNLKTDDFDYFCINCNKWIDLILTEIHRISVCQKCVTLTEIHRISVCQKCVTFLNISEQIIRIIDLYDSGYYCHSKLIVENC